MCRLPFAIIAFLWLGGLFAQSPHGPGFTISCEQCHSPSGWSIDYNSLRFDHDRKTDFALDGAHELTSCTSCHQDLSFKGAPQDCASCHTDLHNQTVGNDCARCHNSESWLVAEIPEIHEQNGFALTGSHSNVSCTECHTDANPLNFFPVGNDCYSCHSDDYVSTDSPNHQQAGYSMDCTECHTPLGFGWDSENINHDFFPLTQGHDIADCMRCHTTGNYADASPECVSCHQQDYQATQDPNHQASGFSTDCVNCHTTAPGWSPANINHDFFPLTQGHNLQDCTRCHTTGNYADASPECVSCHQTDYDGTQDPNHQSAGYSTDCATCHSTAPGWRPATVNHDFFPLTLGHDIQDCTRCHTTGSYADLSPECINCHQVDYNQTSDPNHQAANFPVDCAACHTTDPGWTPVNWDHDSQYFPIYSGKHRGEWNSCTECHTNAANYADFSCFACHGQNETNNDHSEVNGYTYDSMACLECHPDGND